VRKGGLGPRQPGGGRQQAGPRQRNRGGKRPHSSIRHPEVRAQRASKGDGPGHSGRSSFEAQPLRGRAPQDDGVKPALVAMPTSVQTVTVSPDEANMRVDRFFEARFPGLSFSHIQRIIRKGEVRVNGKRTQPKARLEAGQRLRRSSWRRRA
jgi:23S rRNA pseudouridine955/2504/2580 synthase